MKKGFILATIACLFLSLFFLGCKDKQEKFDNSLLWKISGNGLQKPSYILGVYNFFDPNLLAQVDRWEECFDNSDQFVAELIVDEDQEVWLQDTIKSISKQIMGEGYQKRLSDKDYARLDEALKKALNTSVEDIKYLNPNLIFPTYLRMLCYSVDSTYNLVCQESMDSYLEGLAKQKSKPSLGLESVDERIALLLPKDRFQENIDVLINSLENIESNKAKMKEFNSAYKGQSLSKIYNLYARNQNDSTSLFKRQLDMSRKRNADWLAKLPNIMKDKSSFIVVGVLSLAGDDGILAELEKQGYTVEPVTKQK